MNRMDPSSLPNLPKQTETITNNTTRNAHNAQSANQPKQAKPIIRMDLKCYNAAVEGKIEFFKDKSTLNSLLTPNKSTVLHIYITALNSESKSTTPNLKIFEKINPNTILAQYCFTARMKSTFFRGRLNLTSPNAGYSESGTHFVEEILKMCPSLLEQANAKDETPLHIAARYGHSDVVKVLINSCDQQTLQRDLEDGIAPRKEMLGKKNKKKDTALHEAVRYNHLEVVKLLIRQDPKLSYSANDDGETPLYIAAERGFQNVLSEILDKCKSPMHGGPLGRTALHAAVIRDDTDMAQKILDKNIEGICSEADDKGWTPLHLAARLDCSSKLANLLLNKDKDVAYMQDNIGRTALHIAAQRGHSGAMKSIVSNCPDCCDVVDIRGWNVLHFAMKRDLRPNHYLNTKGGAFLKDIIEIIVKDSALSNLLNEKNNAGDTPLHFFYSHPRKSLSSLESSFVRHPRVDTMAFNNENLGAYDIASIHAKLPAYDIASIHAKLPLMKLRCRRVIKDEDDTTKPETKEERDESMKASEAHLVVAALITTVTFAACITVPGGFVDKEGSQPGSALLMKNAAFKAFIISDTISMILSSSALSIHLVMPILLDKHFNKKKRKKLLKWAFIFIWYAMVAMGVAFVTGTYAVLAHSPGLAIANLIIGLLFFCILSLVIQTE